MSKVTNSMCKTCCKLALSCCQNPRIPWTMADLKRLTAENPLAMSDSRIGVFRGKVTGVVFIADETSNTALEKCVFFDEVKGLCRIYNQRPAVCRTYGDSRYNPCPYDGMDEEGLKELHRTDLEKCVELHNVVPPKKAQDRLISEYFSDTLSSDERSLWLSFRMVNWKDKDGN